MEDIEKVILECSDLEKITGGYEKKTLYEDKPFCDDLKKEIKRLKSLGKSKADCVRILYEYCKTAGYVVFPYPLAEFVYKFYDRL